MAKSRALVPILFSKRLRSSRKGGQSNEGNKRTVPILFSKRLRSSTCRAYMLVLWRLQFQSFFLKGFVHLVKNKAEGVLKVNDKFQSFFLKGFVHQNKQGENYDKGKEFQSFFLKGFVHPNPLCLGKSYP